MDQEETTPDERTVPFFPDHFMTEVRVTIVLLVAIAALGLWGMQHPPELGEPPDPMVTPLHIKPEWYFLFLYQLLKYIPKTIGATLPIIAVALIALWPFIDRKPDTSRRQYRRRFVVSVLAMVVIIVLSIAGGAS
jgi:quinol-cytochrome oxidoreductase complex cytochrome b subunit